MTPIGLLHAQPTHLRKVALLYVVLATLGVTLPAVAAQRRGTLPHPTEQAAHRSVDSAARR